MEEECPRREEDSHDSINFIDTISPFQDDGDDEYADITHEKLDEVRKRGAKEGWLRVLNQLTED
jgi:hypothetical protein